MTPQQRELARKVAARIDGLPWSPDEILEDDDRDHFNMECELFHLDQPSCLASQRLNEWSLRETRGGSERTGRRT